MLTAEDVDILTALRAKGIDKQRPKVRNDTHLSVRMFVFQLFCCKYIKKLRVERLKFKVFTNFAQNFVEL